MWHTHSLAVGAANPSVCESRSRNGADYPFTSPPDRQGLERLSVALAAVEQRVNLLDAEFVASQEQMISDIAELKADEGHSCQGLFSTFGPGQPQRIA